jgi:hypothetical protein
MNKTEKITDDLLSRYIAPERIEKAPEGFTSKVMTLVRLEKSHLVPEERSWKKNLVPVTSVAVIVLLIVSAFLIPEDKTDPFVSPVMSFMKNIKFSFPEINVSSVFRFSLPSVFMYVIVGIIILTVFDRALFRVFHRDKQ